MGEIILSGCAPTASCLLHQRVLADLQIVINGDMWKGDPAGEHWIRAWLKWGSPFLEGTSYPFAKSEHKRRLHSYWYFGECLEMKDNQQQICAQHQTTPQQHTDARRSADEFFPDWALEPLV